MSFNPRRSRNPNRPTTLQADNISQEASRVSASNFILDHEATEHNLRQASTALDAAYRRIRHLRNSLHQIAESMPQNSTLARNFRRSNVAPQPPGPVRHPNNMLSSESDIENTLERMEQTLPPNMLERFRRMEAGLRSARLDEHERARLQERLTQARPFSNSPISSLAPRQIDSQSISPSTTEPLTLSPSSSTFPPRQSWNDISNALRHFSRELGTDTLETSMRAEEALDRAAQLQERLNNLPRPEMRFSEPQPMTRPEVTSDRTESGSLDSQLVFSNRGLLPGNQLFSRAIPSRGLNRAVLNEMNSSGRLSTLSSFSIDNLRTPSTPDTRLLLFDEPHSYEPDTASRSADLAHSVDRRSYQIRRMVNADGDEYVHNIDIGVFEDGPNFSEGSSGDATTRQNTLGLREFYWVDGALRNPEASQPRTGRRRVWPYLDADGDDVPMHEAEHERSRRFADELRERFETHLPVQNGSLVPVTRNAMNQGEEDQGIARVRMVPRRESQFQSGSGSGTATERLSRRSTCPHRACSSEPAFFGTSEPFVPDPLPMPLSGMVLSKSNSDARIAPSQEKLRVARATLPKGFVWAGR